MRDGRYATLVGRGYVIAGADCGLAAFAAALPVHPTVTWAKLRAMAAGALLASAPLWSANAG